MQGSWHCDRRCMQVRFLILRLDERFLSVPGRKGEEVALRIACRTGGSHDS